MLFALATLFIIISYSVGVNSAKILAFLPFPSESHHIFHESVIRLLAENGHQVTSYTPFPLQDPPINYTEILIPNLSEHVKGRYDFKEFSKASTVRQVYTSMSIGVQFQKRICQEPAVRELIESNNKEFDIVISEALFCQESFVALRHKFNAHSVDLMSLGGLSWQNFLLGNSFDPSYVPDGRSEFTDRMTFQQRLINTYKTLSTIAIGRFIFLPKAQQIMDECFNYSGWQSRPPISSLISNISLTIVNSHKTLTYPLPHAHNVIEVAGLHLRKKGGLNEDLKRFMDSAPQGVIYFSLGTNLRSDKLRSTVEFETFLHVFSSLKQKVVMKLNHDVSNLPSNVKVLKWLPQSDILAHKNCRLFITHGGFLSTTEAVYHGVPIIGIPFYADQHKNIMHGVISGYGLRLDFSNITIESLNWTIQEILQNQKYKEASKATSDLFKDRPLKPSEEVLYWVNYVLRHSGAHHLKSGRMTLAWWEYLLLDVILLVLVLVASTVLLLLKICQYLLKTQQAYNKKKLL